MPEDLKWFHVTLGTYGSWLPGDPRGFRTRRHRMDVEGDYRNPPPTGKFDDVPARSRRRMKHESTSIPREWRPVLVDAFRENLEAQGSIVACIAMASRHAHILSKLPPSQTWMWIGNAKRHAWFVWRELAAGVKLWGKKGESAPRSRIASTR